ncbi:hypothetical protein PLICRDRAFT_44030 [Plicaturopsis crispa FD-325 SS-3]|nr:hypothetical protein PLICRDRAFT_44030 [Plicaturopsis crispa FD-325 SS-3]
MSSAMVSHASSSPSMLEHSKRTAEVVLNELGSLCDAVEPFTQLIGRAGQSVRLHCTIPTWAPSSDTCLDLLDFHDLRSRFLIFIHKVLESLRASGVYATYHLTPSNSPLCLICALPPDMSAFKAQHAAIDALQHTHLDKKDNVMLADLEHGPALIIT